MKQKGQKAKHYYVPESVGIAAGFLLAALHVAGLATLTHTPNPMGFQARICGRPANARAFPSVNGSRWRKSASRSPRSPRGFPVLSAFDAV